MQYSNAQKAIFMVKKIRGGYLKLHCVKDQWYESYRGCHFYCYLINKLASVSTSQSCNTSYQGNLPYIATWDADTSVTNPMGGKYC